MILSLPLLFLGTTGYQDWGDDFAQYLLQARQLVTGEAQGIPDGMFPPRLAITAYPIGFPMLLAPILWLWGDSIFICQVFLSLLWISFGAVFYWMVRRITRETWSLLITLMVLYNPVLWMYKTQLLSEIPFLFVLYTFFYLVTEHQEQVQRRGKILLFLLVLLPSLRLPGLLMIPTVWLTMPYSWTIGRKLTFTVNRWTLTALSAALLFLIHHVLFGIDLFGLTFFYQDAWIRKGTGLSANYLVYYDALGSLIPFPFLKSTVPSWAIAGLLLRGLYYDVRARHPMGVFILLYLILLLLYPYQGGAIRFLLPVIPYLSLQLFSLIIYISNRIPSRGSSVLISLCLIFFLVGDIRASYSKLNDIKTAGSPQDTASTALFTFIRSHVEDSTAIVFCKPRAMYYYTGKSSTYFPPDADVIEQQKYLHSKGRHLMVLGNEKNQPDLQDPSLSNYLLAHVTEYDTLWRNSDFLCLTSRSGVRRQNLLPE